MSDKLIDYEIDLLRSMNGEDVPGLRWGAAMQPPHIKPTKCAVCQKCWMDPATGRCMCGGPFAGYQPPPSMR